MSNTMHAAVDFDAILADAKAPERTVDVCLRGDLHTAWQDVERRLAEAIAEASQSLAGTSELAQELRAQVEAIRDRMKAATVTFHLRALSKPKVDKIKLAHPPREDNKDDKAAGFDRDAVNNALIRACIYEPEMTDARWDRLVGEDGVLTQHQYLEILEAAMDLCFGPVDLPFSFAALASLSSSDES